MTQVMSPVIRRHMAINNKPGRSSVFTWRWTCLNASIVTNLVFRHVTLVSWTRWTNHTLAGVAGPLVKSWLGVRHADTDVPALTSPLMKGTDQSAGRHRSSTQHFRTIQNHDVALRLIMQWSEWGQNPHWDEVAGYSSTTKGVRNIKISGWRMGCCKEPGKS